jgi:putative flavoprotein involved in K+ transport
MSYAGRGARCGCPSAHDRPPRRYRQRDFCWWLGVLGLWDAAANQPGKEHVTIAVSGARGGHTVDFRQLAHRGTLVGQTTALPGAKPFPHDLADNIRRGDASYLALLDAPMTRIARNGWTLPEEPEARFFLPDPDCLTQPLPSSRPGRGGRAPSSGLPATHRLSLAEGQRL